MMIFGITAVNFFLKKNSRSIWLNKELSSFQKTIDISHNIGYNNIEY